MKQWLGSLRPWCEAGAIRECGGSGVEVTKTGEAGLFQSMTRGGMGSFAVLMMCSMGVKWRVTKNVVREKRVRAVDYGTSSVLE